MISSAIPSVKYSLSGSALMLAKGSTATDLAADTACCGIVCVSVGVSRPLEPSALAKMAEVV